MIMVCRLHQSFDRQEFLITNILPVFNLRTTNRKCAKHKQISDRKIGLNNSVGQNLTCNHAQITIFSCKLVISAVFKIFLKNWKIKTWMRSKIAS